MTHPTAAFFREGHHRMDAMAHKTPRVQPAANSARTIGSVFLLAASLVCWGGLLSFDAGDWPSPHQHPHNHPTVNACGRAGAFVAYELLYCLGDGAYLLTLFTTLAAGTWLVHGRVQSLLQRLAGLVLLVSCTAAAVHVVSSPGSGPLPEGHGGILGTALGDFITENFSAFGAFVVLAYSLLVGLLLAAEGWVLRLPAMFRRAVRPAPGLSIGGNLATAMADSGVGRDGGRTVRRAVTHEPSAVKAGEPIQRRASDDATGTTEAPPRAPLRINPNRSTSASGEESLFDPKRPHPSRDREGAGDEGKPSPLPHGRGPGKEGPGLEKSRPAASDGAPATGEREESAPPDSQQPRRASTVPVRRLEPPAPERAEAYPREIEDWVFPPPALLGEPEYNFGAHQESIVRAKAKVLERTLEEFRLDAQVVEIDTGPVITVFELSLAPGVKVAQISSLANDVARALKAPAVRVVAPIPGKNTIGIEVPNVEKEKVRLRELITVGGGKAREMALPLFLGKDASGAPLVADLAVMPHLLIAGTTGSGKSVCINSIIASLLMTQRPDWCKLILVDPKMVEMSQFREVPHLMCPIVTDMKRAESILEWAVTKMEERYELLSEVGVRHIKAFNALDKAAIYERLQPASDEERARICTHLPYVVIVIDELADLMMTSAKEVEHYLSRLAQKSRAVGIHIVVATQRPEVKVVTGLVKSNLPCRIAFRVASRMDSRIVLDQNGAEVLMGQGDMLFLPPGSAKLLRAQGTYLEDQELHTIIDFLKERAEPEFHPELVRLQKTDAAGSGERDALFDDAVRIVLETRRGSVSLLQRRLNVGYSRASRLIDEMAEAGIVGIYKGSQAREVNLTLEEWEELQQRTAAERAAEDDFAPQADSLDDDVS